MEKFIASSAFEKATIKRLSAAVQVKTESYDDLGKIGEDKRWDVQYDFNKYLKKTFPRIFSQLRIEYVNTHGLFITWNGTEPELKPTLLMAHMDTVPVPPETIDQWTHPPWSGYYDGKFVWGRGSSDCKNQLLAVLESVDLLLENGFVPKRTVLMSFGFDEERGGPQGAGHLAPFIFERYGKDALAVIVDEGGGFADNWGASMCMPGVAEKGHIDVEIVIRMPGGHSSIPLPHTAIGVMSELIVLIEDNPYEPHLVDKNPYLGALYCGADHAPDFPDKLRKILEKSRGHETCNAANDELAQEAAKMSPFVRYLMQTSQAADIIGGGVKVNAMPERVSAFVNHRINIGSTSESVKTKVTSLAQQIAEKHNLTLHAFDDAKEERNSIFLKAGYNELEPAPLTPTNVDELTAYAVLSGTVRALYGEDVIVAPGLMTGNTDTRYYWDLTRHIFRFAPGWDGEQGGLANGVHTVDEHVSVKAHINGVKWFSLFIRNMDEATLD
ncbi:Zn-dependent exopeptidase [Rhizodiscina lignyota]|uniref:Zn-dependent exopeptidase n=1 Tax=Rhizodiscina lignyota TaxID=1504668 RepID=A0A9P4IJT1_9PEZI|nr:Zn-dependent exopeptidase [Rhizodiscina lignyota]